MLQRMMRGHLHLNVAGRLTRINLRVPREDVQGLAGHAHYRARTNASKAAVGSFFPTGAYCKQNWLTSAATNGGNVEVVRECSGEDEVYSLVNIL